MAAFIIFIIRWGVVFTLLYSLYGLFLKQETLHGFNRVVLLVILVASMVLPLCQIKIKEPNYVTQGREIVETKIVSLQQILEITNEPWLHRKEYIEKIKKEEINNPEILTQRSHDESNKLKDDGWTWSWMHTLLLAIEIYLVGLLFCWVRYFWQLVSLFQIIRKGKRANIEGLPKYVHAITHPDIKTPCSWMRWMILNPSDVNTRAIINHELAHIRLRHSWDMLLCEFTCRMLWCVPFVWMLRQDLRDVHEYQADRRVLATGIKDEDYQLLLIRKATGTGLQPIVNALNQSPIKRRLKMMYRKPSRRWVALKAVYLLPLSLMALMAFARPQAMSEIEQKVEITEKEIIHYVATATWNESSSDESQIRQQGEVDSKSPTQDRGIANSSEQPDTVMVMTDANLVKADLADSQPAEEAFVELSVKRACELLDSTMQAVGARKIADGTWIGHFQPSLNNDTVRVAKVEYLDKQSRQTGKLQFSFNESDPYAYNMILQDETRKERTGYYIRKLYPAKATARQYDKPNNDPKILSMDAVLVKGLDPFKLQPIAMERNKKETRLYLFLPLASNYFEQMPNSEKVKQFEERFSMNNYAIHDVATGDKYMYRSMDKSYFKLADVDKEDTIFIYQVCLIFPPLDKKVKEVMLAPVKWNLEYGITAFKLKDIPTKARVITN